MKTSNIKDKPGKIKMAVLDLEEVHLYYEDNGKVEDIPWPDDWPEFVHVKFLRKKGFRVISA